MSSKEECFRKIEQTLKDNDVVLYMKGSAAFPACGFSMRVVECLKSLGVKFLDIDVMQDPDLRNYLKEFSNWPTFPQLYINSELIGGHDIIFDMLKSGDLKKILTLNEDNHLI